MRVPSAGRARRLLCAVVVATASLCALSPGASAADAGSVRFAKAAESSFDAFTKSPTAAQQGWMRDHYWRMRTYAPYFNSRLSWFPGAWVYKNAYAIYANDATAVAAHPEWILKDAAGKRLYVQFGCSGGTCPQYAADIGNPAFRASWIASARSVLAAGYKGLFIDDVNMYRRVSDGSGTARAPIDPRTGTEMTDAMWQRHMADFMVEVRNALPNAEIVHNSIWFAGDATANHLRQLRAADYVDLERGVNDAGLTGGTGKFALRTLLAYVDRRHGEGHGVVFDSNAGSDAARMYGLAAYFLVSSGRDALGTNAGGTPADWWTGYDVQLGAPSGPRYAAGGLLRRDFAGGTAIVNEPGSVTRTLPVGSGYRDLKGNPVAIVTLAPAAGIVLLKQAGAAAPGSTVTTAPSRPKRSRLRLEVRVRRLATASARSASRAVKVSGRVSGGRAGRVHLRVRHGGRAVVRRALRLRRGGSFAHVQRLRPGVYRLRVTYRGGGGARQVKRFSVR